MAVAPNGLAFSCRERAGRSLQNVNDLARAAVGCTHVVGGSAYQRWRFAASGHGIRSIRNYATTPILLGAPKPLALQQALLPVRLAMQERLRVGITSRYPQIAGLSRELLSQWEALWTFSRVEGVEPTNNAAERALQPAVLWRKGCFGSRSAEGSQFVERLLSMRATCVVQRQALFAFLTAAVRAAWANQPVPILVPSP